MRRRCRPIALLPHCVVPTKLIIRVKLEQQTYAGSSIVHEPVTDCLERISGLQALLEGAPPLPERKLLWHCALEKLLDGTREGLNAFLVLGDRDLGLKQRQSCTLEWKSWKC